MKLHCESVMRLRAGGNHKAAQSAAAVTEPQDSRGDANADVDDPRRLVSVQDGCHARGRDRGPHHTQGI